MRRDELLRALRGGALDDRLAAVYGAPAVADARARCASVIRGFCARFDPDGARELSVFSAPGRTELGGNHTDHQNGFALAASVDLDTLACVARAEGRIRVCSKGHAEAAVDLADLSVRARELGRSVSLVRGVAAGVAARGYAVAGFDAYTETRVLRGSGLSSSAAFEVLLGAILNELCCCGALTAVELAQIGQYAENVYYGKPCGLLDQMACATGGVVGVDFADPQHPQVEHCAVDLDAAGYALVIIDGGVSHADLSEEYAAIPREMESVARYFGKDKLRAVDPAAFARERAAVATACGERAADRAEHFFAETARAERQFAALSAGDLPAYLALMRASGASSEEKLQNVTTARPNGDALLRVIERARALAGPDGAARVHGGGFAGTAQALVPAARLADFVAGMEAALKPGCCHVLHIRSLGPARLI